MHTQQIFNAASTVLLNVAQLCGSPLLVLALVLSPSNQLHSYLCECVALLCQCPECSCV
jgi:hypothetical protein